MGYKMNRLLNRFAHDTSGSSTVEFVIWLPMVLMAFGLTVDVSMIFHSQSEVLRIVQDANRTMSIGRFTTTTQTQDYVVSRAQGFSQHASALTTVSADGIITTTATVPMAELDLFGVAGIFRNGQMRVQADHLMEM